MDSLVRVRLVLVARAKGPWFYRAFYVALHRTQVRRPTRSLDLAGVCQLRSAARSARSRLLGRVVNATAVALHAESHGTNDLDARAGRRAANSLRNTPHGLFGRTSDRHTGRTRSGFMQNTG